MQLVLVLLALALASVLGYGPAQLPVVGLLSLALGVQSSVVRQLAVPDPTTTVLTTTLTGIGADLRRRDLATAARRHVTVAGTGLGAFVGAVLVLGVGLGAGLVAVAVVTAVALLATALVSRGEPGWSAP